MCFPVLSRRHPIFFLKRAVKGPLTFKPAVHTYLRNRKVRIFQTGAGVTQPGPIQIPVKITAKRSGKNSGQHIFADAKFRSHRCESEPFAEIGRYISRRPIDQVIVSAARLQIKLQSGQTFREQNLHISLCQHKVFFPDSR